MLGLWVPVPALCLPGHACVPIQHTRAVDPQCFPSDDSLPPCFSGGPPHGRVSPLQGPYDTLLKQPLSRGSVLRGAALPEDHPGERPGAACLVGPRPGRFGLLSVVDNGAFHVSSEEAKQNNPTLAPSSPSCRPPTALCFL